MFAISTVALAQPSPPNQIKVLTNATGVQSGKPIEIAIVLKLSHGWHTYWQNPGDSGSPTTVAWKLPAGWTAGSLRFPAPERIALAGIVSYGYEQTTTLLQTLTPPTGTHLSQFILKGKVGWLTCTDQMCEPAKGDFVLKIGPENGSASNAAMFQRLAKQSSSAEPVADRNWQVVAERNGPKSILLKFAGPGCDHVKAAGCYFYADQPAMVDHSQPQKFVKASGGWTAVIPVSPYATKPPSRLTGVIRAPAGETWGGLGSAVTIDVPVSTKEEKLR